MKALTAPHHILRYRPEIDGLRAIAVLAVIFFHAEFAWMSGGFLGVDVFFVISGYLIAAIIIKEQAEGEFSVAKFLERRLRRILPALILLCVVCFIPAWFILPPSDLKDYAESVAANGLAVANYYFLSQIEYFDQAAEFKPLLHTWSLSVEIQFYLFISIVFFVGQKLPSTSAKNAVWFLGLSSFALYVWLFHRDMNISFYLFPTRVWEFSFGIASALLLAADIRKSSFLSLLGLAFVFCAVAGYEMFPSQVMATLTVVIGTSLIIIFTSSQDLVAKLLTLPLLVSIGIVSYSLYLFHNPILSFARYLNIQHELWFLLTGAIFLIIISYFSWRFVEKPFRNPLQVNRVNFSSVCIAFVIFAAAMLIMADQTKGFSEQRMSLQQLEILSTARSDGRKPRCQISDEKYRPPSEPCSLYGQQPEWAILGDSHAGAIAHTMADVVHQHTGSAMQWLSLLGCPPSYGHGQGLCRSWIEEAVMALSDNPQITTVLLVYRLNVYMFGNQVGNYPHVGSAPSGPNKEVIWQSFEEIVQSLIEAGKQVIVISPIPEPRQNVMDLIFREGNNSPDIYAVKREDWERRNSFVTSQLEHLEGVYLYQPETALCDEDYCWAVRNKNAYYYDHNHLSAIGARLIAEGFAKRYWPK
ncbi:MAG: acyltransferase family protein [Chromatiales bacterium]